MRQFKPSLSEATLAYTRFNSLRGFGRFIGELDNATNMLRTKHLNPPHMYLLPKLWKTYGILV